MFKMKPKFVRTFVSVISFIVVLTFSFSATAAEMVAIGTVTGSVVNVRKGAGVDFEIVSQFSRGSAVNVTEISDDWVKVEYADGQFGYMSAQYVSIDTQVKGTITGGVVNVRSGAGMDYEVVGQVYEGQTFTVVSREQLGWTAISYNGMRGYVNNDYISLDKTENNEAIAEGNVIVEAAKKYLGCAYVYGASGPNAFDCSGFTSYVFKKLGYNINRTAAGQYANGTYVAKSDLQPGDLVMFAKGSYISHVGIYIGNGNMIHAQNAATGVCITSIHTNYYSSHYYGARRIL